MTIEEMRRAMREKVVPEEVVPQNVVNMLIDDEAEPPKLDAFTFLTRLRALGMGSADFLNLLEGCNAPEEVVEKIRQNPRMNLQGLILTLDNSSLTSEDYTEMLLTARQVWERTLTLRLEKSKKAVRDMEDGEADEATADLSGISEAARNEEQYDDYDDDEDEEEEEGELDELVKLNEPYEEPEEAEEPDDAEESEEDYEDDELDYDETMREMSFTEVLDMITAENVSARNKAAEAEKTDAEQTDGETGASENENPEEPADNASGEEDYGASFAAAFDKIKTSKAKSSTVDTTTLVQIDEEQLRRDLAKLSGSGEEEAKPAEPEPVPRDPEQSELDREIEETARRLEELKAARQKRAAAFVREMEKESGEAEKSAEKPDDPEDEEETEETEEITEYKARKIKLIKDDDSALDEDDDDDEEYEEDDEDEEADNDGSEEEYEEDEEEYEEDDDDDDDYDDDDDRGGRKKSYKGLIIGAAAGAAALVAAGVIIGNVVANKKDDSLHFAQDSNEIFQKIYTAYDQNITGGLLAAEMCEPGVMFGDLLVSGGEDNVLGSYKIGGGVYMVTEGAVAVTKPQNGSLMQIPDIQVPKESHFVAAFSDGSALYALFSGEQSGYMKITEGGEAYTVKQDGFLTSYELTDDSVKLATVYTPVFEHTFGVGDEDIYLPCVGVGEQPKVIAANRILISETTGYSYGVSADYSKANGAVSNACAVIGDPVAAGTNGRFALTGESGLLVKIDGEKIKSEKTARLTRGAFSANGAAICETETANTSKGDIKLLDNDFRTAMVLRGYSNVPKKMWFEGTTFNAQDSSGGIAMINCGDPSAASVIEFEQVTGAVIDNSAIIFRKTDDGIVLRRYDMVNGKPEMIGEYEKKLTVEGLASVRFGVPRAAVIEGTASGAAYSWFDGVSKVSEYVVFEADVRPRVVTEFDDKTGFTAAFSDGGKIKAVCANGMKVPS